MLRQRGTRRAELRLQTAESVRAKDFSPLQAVKTPHRMCGTYGKDTMNVSGEPLNRPLGPFIGLEHRFNGPAGLLFGYEGRLNGLQTPFKSRKEQKNRRHLRMKTAQGQTFRPAPAFFLHNLLLKEEQE
ncbi:hypothetical protein LDFHOB_13850 [Candidatus Electronema aureum]